MKAAYPIIILCAVFLSGCSLAKPYRASEVKTPSAFKYSSSDQDSLAPQIADFDPGKWWLIFDDRVLTELIEASLTDNFDINVALLRVQEANETVSKARADFLPVIDSNPSFERSRSPGRNLGSFRTTGFTDNNYILPVDISYEADIWGRVVNSIRSAKAKSQSFVQAHKTLELSITSEIARLYFDLRRLDSELAILEKTIALRKQALEFITNQSAGGISNELDRQRVQTEVHNAKIEIFKSMREREKTEIAIAILCGKNPAEFSLAKKPFGGEPPVIPTGIPSELLKRRPDILQAEYDIDSAFAEMKLARDIFLPTITLSASGGFEDTKSSTLFEDGSRAWSLKGQVAVPIFSGGKNRAHYGEAKARYRQQVAAYKQTVLNAFADVEQALSDIDLLEKESAVHKNVIISSQKTSELSITRLREGIVDVLELVDAERIRLQAELAAVRNLNQRFASSILLIKALGGPWRGTGG